MVADLSKSTREDFCAHTKSDRSSNPTLTLVVASLAVMMAFLDALAVTTALPSVRYEGNEERSASSDHDVRQQQDQGGNREQHRAAGGKNGEPM